MAAALATHLAFPGRGRPKALGEKVKKDLHFRRHIAALWVYGVGSTRETAELRHDLLQTAVAQVGTNYERRQHADAEAGQVPHVVYSSVSDADRATGVPHFDSKYEVEKYFQSLNVPWTVVAPVYFFGNPLFP
jgi:uncharacterized protein YbjT (DUF2867 family)